MAGSREDSFLIGLVSRVPDVLPSRPEYRRVYWDAEPLSSKPYYWPQVTSEVRYAQTLLKAFGVSSVLLAPVERQLEARWLTEYRSLRESSKGKLDKFRQFGKEFGLEIGTLPSLPSQADAQVVLKSAVDSTVGKYGFTRTSPALRDTAELFDMAINHQKPFGQEGKNFQDAVILFAAINDLRDSGDGVGGFVSADGDFDQETIDKHATLAGVKLRLFVGAEALTADLRPHLQAMVIDEWQRNERAAIEAIEANLPAIQRFVEANLEIPETAAGLFGKILSIERIEIGRVARVAMPPPWELEEGKEVTLTATLELRILGNMWLPDFSPFAPPKVLKVGEEPKVQTTTAVPLTGGTPPNNALAKQAAVEIKAVYRDSRFVDLVPISVSLDTPKLGDRTP